MRIDDDCHTRTCAASHAMVLAIFGKCEQVVAETGISFFLERHYSSRTKQQPMICSPITAGPIH
jgi:hypothetical protein